MKSSNPPPARSLAKHIALWLLGNRWFNRLVVAILRRVPALRWRARIPVLEGTGMLELAPGSAIEMHNPHRCSIARELFWHGGRLASPADRITLSLAADLSVSAEMFLDVGSYTGLFALAVTRRRPAVTAHAFEIVPENYLFLWENVVRNDLVRRIQPHLMGIGGEPGSIRVNTDFGPGVLASSIALDAQHSEGVEIPVAPLDILFPDFSGRFVMKIDVECFEWPVLEGAEKLIARNSPDIICEFLTRAPHLPEVKRFLDANGYTTYRITDEGLCACASIVPVKVERDWLLTKRRRGELEALGYRILDNGVPS